MVTLTTGNSSTCLAMRFVVVFWFIFISFGMISFWVVKCRWSGAMMDWNESSLMCRCILNKSTTQQMQSSHRRFRPMQPAIMQSLWNVIDCMHIGVSWKGHQEVKNGHTKSISIIISYRISLSFIHAGQFVDRINRNLCKLTILT